MMSAVDFPEIRLRPGLDPEPFAREYAKGEIVQVPDIFEPHVAHAIQNMLMTLNWRLVYSDPKEGMVQLTAADRQRLGQTEMGRRMQGVMERATRNYGFCYNAYHMNKAERENWDPGHPVHKLTQFLNGPEFQGFGAAIIGETGIVSTEAHATLYTRGSFLTRHIDDGLHDERRCAYTLGFSENWMTDWGGMLLFIDKQTTDVTSGFLPRFNVLTLFNGRKVHSVSAVSAFAGHPRLSIAGWLRNRPL